jgi:hypothetical protein
MVEWCRVLPAFAERIGEIADRRTSHLELNVVPGRSSAVPLVELNGLRVSLVTRVVVSAVAEVDTADEGDIVGSIVGAAHNNDLLVMTAPHVARVRRAGSRPPVVDLANELGVLLLAEVRLPGMRAPQQAAHVNAPSREIRQHISDRGTGAVEKFVGVALPVGEVQPVSRRARPDNLVQTDEVLRAVDQHLDAIAFAPGLAVAPAAVDIGGSIPALHRREEPFVEAHGVLLGRQTAPRRKYRRTAVACLRGARRGGHDELLAAVPLGAMCVDDQRR